MTTRRAFLGAFAAAACSGPTRRSDAAPPLRAITRGPGFHWFGYYDKHQFDTSGRWVLGNRVAFENRSPQAGDEIEVGMVDLRDGDRWIALGTTRAWNWQQGCMLQWVPGTAAMVAWNDREGDRFVCRLLDVRTRERRTVPFPVYALSEDGGFAVTTDFRRLNDCRPGYGYAGCADPHAGTAAPGATGIWHVDLQSGAARLLLSYADVAGIAQPGGYSRGAKHWCNHLLIAPGGERFVFLHRWRGAAEGKGWKTRMFTAGTDGSGLHLLIASGKVSHFVWRDARHVLAYAGLGDGWRFQVFEDRTDRAEAVEGMLPVDGHCTYLPGNATILCDTYPDHARLQKPYLLHVPTQRLTTLARLRAPEQYTGEWRCDTHPRASRDGKLVCIDSAHDGGRQMYLIEIVS